MDLISTAGDIVKSINLSLLSYKPPAIEETGHDVCYLGKKYGENDHNSVTYCNDLPIGQRAMVGSWYLHPERHVIEYIVYVSISLILICTILPTLSRYPKNKADNMKLPLPMKLLTAFIFTTQLIYKLSGYPGKWTFMMMPCNAVWTMWTILCFIPLPTQVMHIMHQLIIPYTGLALVALATPDTSDLLMYMEIPFFFFMHVVLPLYPLYFLRSDKISVLATNHDNNSNDDTGIVTNFIKWWILACSYFALFYFGIVTPISLKYGLNVNYMLSPPPTPGDLVGGPNYRLQSTLCCGSLFFFISFLVTVKEVVTASSKKTQKKTV